MYNVNVLRVFFILTFQSKKKIVVVNVLNLFYLLKGILYEIHNSKPVLKFPF